MSYLRVKHVFIALMGLSALSAFVIPPDYSSRLRPPVQSLFAPVSRPAGSLASWISERVAPPAADDKRAITDIRQENRYLRATVAMLQSQLEEMNWRDSELAKLGKAKDVSQWAKVIAVDSGTHDSIYLAASTIDGVRQDMYVLCPDGLVGRIQQSGVGGSQVQLITDRGFRIRVRFAKYGMHQGKPQYQPLGVPITVAEGAGEGVIVVPGLKLSDIGVDSSNSSSSGEKLLQEGDYVQVWDSDCPQRLQGFVLGRISRIEPRPDARLFAQIRILPTVNLKKLREVMVMTKEN